MKKIAVIFLLLIVISGSLFSEEMYSTLKTGINAKATGFTSIFDLETFYLAQMSLGITLHIIPQLAIRPSIVLLSVNEKYQDIFNNGDEMTEAENMCMGGGADLLYFVPLQGKLAVYFGGGYTFISSNRVNYSTTNGNKSSQYEYTYHIIKGIIGTQYLLDKNFGFFCETGLNYNIYSYNYTGYDTGTGNITSEVYRSDSYMFFQIPTFGAVFYFN